MKQKFLPGEIMVTGGSGRYEYRLCDAETPAPTKEQKLITRGSQAPSVAHLAKATAEMLIRFSLGQAGLFADALLTAFPNPSAVELEKIAAVLDAASDYLRAKRGNLFTPKIDYEPGAVRSWTPEFHDLVKIFCVLSCEQEYCAFIDCWETRRWDCKDDNDKLKALNEDPNEQARMKKEWFDK